MNNGNNNEKKKKNLKNVIGLLVGLGIVVVVVVLIGVFTNDKKNNVMVDDDTIVNKNQGVIKDREFDGLDFTNTSLTSTNGSSTFVTKVTNNTGEDYYLNEFHIVVKDKDGNDVISYYDGDGKEVNYLVGYVGEVIKNGQSVEVNSNIDREIADKAYNLEYNVVK